MILKVFKKVFFLPLYASIAALVSLMVFSFAVWIPNWNLIKILITSSSVSFFEALKVIFSLFSSIGTNFTFISASYTIAISILFGMNVSLLVYYISIRKGSFKSKGGILGVGGIVSGVFGIGCAACGTFILSSVLALVGAGGIVALLPLGGEEFGILGVLLTGYAVYWTAKKIDEPPVCDSN